MIQKLARTRRKSRVDRNGPPRIRSTAVRILEPSLCAELIRERQAKGIDLYDEVWDGVYVMPPLANNLHQGLVGKLTTILRIVLPESVEVLPGANVSDRRDDWEKNFRCPDIVVVFPDGKAVDCDTHWFGGPDFLVEVRSPKDDTYEKIPFYSHLQVRELLIIERDSRDLRLYRHNGTGLVLVGMSSQKASDGLGSEVVPLVFRWKDVRRKPRTEVKRTTGKRKHWTI
jgi:Uma2 family endonuclease